MKKIKLLFVVCILAVFASCGSGDKMDMKGKWSIDSVELGDGATDEQKAEIEQGLAMMKSMITIDVVDDSKLKIGAMGQTEEGTYKIEGDKLIISGKGEEKSFDIVEHEAGMIKIKMSERGMTGTVTLKRD